jgi:hypothetical protein
MSLQTKIKIAWAGLLLAAPLASAQDTAIGALGLNHPYHDMQLFAPVELDFSNQPTDRGEGFFFTWDKLYWATTGERATVGDPDVARQYQPVWFDNEPAQVNPLLPALGNFVPGFPGTVVTGFPVYQGPDLDLNGDGIIDIHRGAPLNPDTGDPIARPLHISGIRSSAPTAVFAWGDRYEFGFQEHGGGWMAGFIDGPEFQTGDFFGINGGADFQLFAPFLDPNTGEQIIIGEIGHEQTGLPGLKSPFGDVYVAFNYAPGLMHGFVDIMRGVSTDPQGRILPTDEDGDGILDGDGFADDLDEDGQFGPDGFDAEDPVYVPETGFFVNEIPDYDDLVELPTSFRTLSVRNATETNGVELMRMHVLSNRRFMKKYQNNHLELYYGARFFQFNDEFIVQGEGGVLGRSIWDTEIGNNIVGPQVMLRWARDKGRLSTIVQGRFMAGYNITNWRQTGAIGEDLIPGDHNHPLYLQPKSFQYGRQDNDFAPLAELRLEGKYRISKSVAINAGYSAIFIDGLRRASTHIDYTLPNMGFVVGDTEHAFINGLNAGIEINH